MIQSLMTNKSSQLQTLTSFLLKRGLLKPFLSIDESANQCSGNKSEMKRVSIGDEHVFTSEDLVRSVCLGRVGSFDISPPRRSAGRWTFL